MAADRDKARDFGHLIALLDRFGAPHPAPGSNHYSGRIGRGFLKWEMHTEFVTYAIFADQVVDQPFSGRLFELFLADCGVSVANGVARLGKRSPSSAPAQGRYA